jgi:hypothetical protein
MQKLLPVALERQLRDKSHLTTPATGNKAMLFCVSINLISSDYSCYRLLSCVRYCVKNYFLTGYEPKLLTLRTTICVRSLCFVERGIEEREMCSLM